MLAARLCGFLGQLFSHLLCCQLRCLIGCACLKITAVDTWRCALCSCELCCCFQWLDAESVDCAGENITLSQFNRTEWRRSSWLWIPPYTAVDCHLRSWQYRQTVHIIPVSFSQTNCTLLCFHFKILICLECWCYECIIVCNTIHPLLLILYCQFLINSYNFLELFVVRLVT